MQYEHTNNTLAHVQSAFVLPFVFVLGCQKSTPAPHVHVSTLAYTCTCKRAALTRTRMKMFICAVFVTCVLVSVLLQACVNFACLCNFCMLNMEAPHLTRTALLVCAATTIIMPKTTTEQPGASDPGRRLARRQKNTTCEPKRASTRHSSVVDSDTCTHSCAHNSCMIARETDASVWCGVSSVLPAHKNPQTLRAY